MPLVQALLILAGIFLLFQLLSRSNRQNIQTLLRVAAGIGAMALGTILIFRGAAVVGGPIAAFGVMLLGLNNPAGFPFPGGGGRGRGGASGSGSGPTSGPTSGTAQRSEVRTKTLQMQLDLDTGHMDGIVLLGQFQARLLSELHQDELIELYEDCLNEDPQSAQLLEAYLDKNVSDWRANYKGTHKSGTEATGTMSKDEAFAVLGVSANATSKDIRDAHRQLMKNFHPDRGGSSYLATKINQAKDVLLGE